MRSISKYIVMSAIVLASAGWALNASAGTTSYKYDALGRIIEVDYADGSTITYAYDAAGNRTQEVRTAGTSSTTPVITKVVVLPLLGGVVIPISG